jgi:hypothetical protein
MANKRISNLPAAGDLIGSEVFIIDQINSEFITGQQTVNINLDNVQNYVLSGGSHLEIEGNAFIFGDLTVTGVLQFDSLDITGDIETTEGRYISAGVDLLDIFPQKAGAITQTITAGNMEIEITDGLITDVNDIVGILGYS